MNKFNIIFLIIKSVLIKIFYTVNHYPSDEIDTYIRFYCLKNVRKLGRNRVIQYFVNPISIIRYFEFDFVRRKLPDLINQKILDVSSPRFFGLYLSSINKRLKYYMINPDRSDLAETKKFLDVQQRNKNFQLKYGNAIKLEYDSFSFDCVISISVIEHIGKNEDSKALREMWRVLKKGGYLIITTHVSNKYYEEFRESNQYRQKVRVKKGKYFFQRVYSPSVLKKRVCGAVGSDPIHSEVICEKRNGWFDEYIKRWIRFGINETVNDPYYVISKFKKIEDVSKVSGLGVIGMVFRKPID
jgi:ubiquinone/menaquinone biosynthesis C-methylase UbiE